jgi:hypothetical protein
MTTPARLLGSLISLLASCVLIAGCSSLTSGGTLKETELAITPTESSVSFSSTAQSAISELDLSSGQLGDPKELEANERLATIHPAARRSHIIAEAWYLRGQNDLEVPLAISLERFLRAAHFSYEALFAESGCETAESQLCKDLTIAYNRSVREVARLTNNGTQPPSSTDTRYIVDLHADNDPLTLSEWEIVLDDEQRAAKATALGAAGSACQSLASESSGGGHRARQCVPLAFLVTFDSRVTDDPSRAHLAAFDTLKRQDIQLHSRTVPLASNNLTPWTEIFAPAQEAPPLTCLGNADAALPSVIFLTPSTQISYEWPVIAAAVSTDPVLHEHYNFCAMPPSDAERSAQDQIENITGSITTLLPGLKPPAHIILVSQGAAGDGAVKALKGALKNVAPRATAPLVVSGTLSFPAPAPLAPNSLPIPISSPGELSRAGHVTLADIKRLLSRLADPEEGIFGGVTRSKFTSSGDGRLSPVM